MYNAVPYITATVVLVLMFMAFVLLVRKVGYKAWLTWGTVLCIAVLVLADLHGTYR